ncbi:hypothetical protein [Allomesorhizobium alhagi]|uniref:Uncharacterized protein n=1 Tax=Mesorhizobium alhagi CCNWXJ12-2 TaxID=1107882 RepID=H0HNJ7_9HYPH|nr:hypothetical protein [Mesorhizobium alhagi]EHK57650.1 hypothetical protein MAXJ12_08599 [Mesorhizobium alhagi CCNWXJ12-2]
MKRRAFLQFLGVGAAAGPSAVKSAAEMSMADLNMPGVGQYLGGKDGEVDSAGDDACEVMSESRMQRTTRRLERLIGKSDAQVAKEKRDQYVSALDPNVASLRSVSLTEKMRIQRLRQYERRRAIEIADYRGILAGLFD